MLSFKRNKTVRSLSLALYCDQQNDGCFLNICWWNDGSFIVFQCKIKLPGQLGYAVLAQLVLIPSKVRPLASRLKILNKLERHVEHPTLSSFETKHSYKDSDVVPFHINF